MYCNMHCPAKAGWPYFVYKGSCRQGMWPLPTFQLPYIVHKPGIATHSSDCWQQNDSPHAVIDPIQTTILAHSRLLSVLFGLKGHDRLSGPKSFGNAHSRDSGQPEWSFNSPLGSRFTTSTAAAVSKTFSPCDTSTLVVAGAFKKGIMVAFPCQRQPFSPLHAA